MAETSKRPPGFRTRKHCGDADDESFYEAEQDAAWRNLEALAALRSSESFPTVLAAIDNAVHFYPGINDQAADAFAQLLKLLHGASK